MDRLALEIRLAVRALVKRPLVTLSIVGTLALGLGANAAIFGVIDALVLRPFPMPDVDRLVMPVETVPDQQYTRETVAPADYLDWRRDMGPGGAIDALAALEWWDASLVGRDEPERLQGFFVSREFFSVLGVRPAIGRVFLPEEETIGNQHRVILADQLWKRRFGGDPGIVGQTVLLDGSPTTVVGIMPAGFDFPDGAEVWSPLAFNPKTAANRTSRYLTVIGRLAPGRTKDDAQAQMSVIADRLTREYPQTNRERTVRVWTFSSGMMDIGLPAILTLWQTAAIVVLLITCANVANLLLARGAERGREIAVRLALGSSRGRIVRETLVESAVVALLAVPLALGVAWVGIHVIRGALPARIARFVFGWMQMGIDARTVLFTSLLALAAAVTFGLAPALQSSGEQVVDALKSDNRSGGNPRRERLRRGLVVAEIALVLPLLVAAMLGLSGIRRYLTGWQGYDPDRILTFRVALPEVRYGTPDAQLRYAEAALEALSAIPGAQQVAVANVLPSLTSNASRRIDVAEHPIDDASKRPSVDYRSVSPAYFATLRLAIVSGRAFTPADRAGTDQVAIVSESLARRHWPDRSAIGGRVRIGDGPWMTVVGICGDVIQDWFDRRNAPTFYRPMAQAPVDAMAFAVKTSADPAAAAPDARRAMMKADPVQPIYEIMPMRQVIRERTAGIQFVAGVMGTFAVLALVLAVLGLYAVMTYLVTMRVHEIGVRIALGATARDVTRLALSQALRLTIVGVVIGLGLALGLGRLMEAGMLGIVSSDARMAIALAVALALVAIGASYLPARRAATVDPIKALRAE
jgi:putative ABC transport system permease protein